MFCTTMPKVSIIMPVFNCEDKVRSAIESVCAQTYHNWNLIIVNDGSSDHSGEICDEYAGKDDRIRVFHISHAGVSTARNIGLKMADGDWIGFLDSDDFLYPVMIERSLEEVLKRQCNLLIFGYQTFPQIKNRSVDYDKRYISYVELANDYKELSALNLINTNWNKLYRRKIIEENQIVFPKNISLGEDLIFNLQYFRVCGGIDIIPDILYRYRYGVPDSLSNTHRIDFLELQKMVKGSIEETFDYDANMVAYAMENYVCNVISGLIGTVYHGKLKREEKLQILRRCIHDDTFCMLYQKVDVSKIRITIIDKWALRKRYAGLLYVSFKLRHFLRRLIDYFAKGATDDEYSNIY